MPKRPKHSYKFGEIVEWSSARWMIVCWTGRGVSSGEKDTALGYDAVWLGHDKGSLPRNIRQVGEIGGIRVDYGPPYLVKTDD